MLYMEYLYYLKTLPEAEKAEQILLILTILGGLLIIEITLEIFKKKYSKQYEIVKKFFNKLNIFNKKETNRDVW